MQNTRKYKKKKSFFLQFKVRLMNYKATMQINAKIYCACFRPISAWLDRAFTTETENSGSISLLDQTKC